MPRTLAKAGQFSIKEIESKDGKSTFYVAEKSRKDEQTGEWKSDSLFVKPIEMAIFAELLLTAFTTIAKEQASAANNRQSGGADF